MFFDQWLSINWHSILVNQAGFNLYSNPESFIDPFRIMMYSVL
jgi:hypothetical protein